MKQPDSERRMSARDPIVDNLILCKHTCLCQTWPRVKFLNLHFGREALKLSNVRGPIFHGCTLRLSGKLEPMASSYVLHETPAPCHSMPRDTYDSSGIAKCIVLKARSQISGQSRCLQSAVQVCCCHILVQLACICM